MKPTRESRKRSSNSSKPPEGKVLSVKRLTSGLSEVQVDNGIPHTFTVVTRTENLGDLLSADLAEIRAHLHSRQPGHFRRKGVTKS